MHASTGHKRGRPNIPLAYVAQELHWKALLPSRVWVSADAPVFEAPAQEGIEHACACRVAPSGRPNTLMEEHIAEAAVDAGGMAPGMGWHTSSCVTIMVLQAADGQPVRMAGRLWAWPLGPQLELEGSSDGMEDVLRVPARRVLWAVPDMGSVWCHWRRLPGHAAGSLHWHTHPTPRVAVDWGMAPNSLLRLWAGAVLAWAWPATGMNVLRGWVAALADSTARRRRPATAALLLIAACRLSLLQGAWPNLPAAARTMLSALLSELTRPSVAAELARAQRLPAAASTGAVTMSTAAAACRVGLPAAVVHAAVATTTELYTLQHGALLALLACFFELHTATTAATTAATTTIDAAAMPSAPVIPVPPAGSTHPRWRRRLLPGTGAAVPRSEDASGSALQGVLAGDQVAVWLPLPLQLHLATLPPLLRHGVQQHTAHVLGCWLQMAGATILGRPIMPGDRCTGCATVDLMAILEGDGDGMLVDVAAGPLPAMSPHPQPALPPFV